MVLELQSWKKIKQNLMDSTSISYNIKTARIKDITTHLFRCKEAFIPPLHNTVNIHRYAEKIAENAVTFEAWHNEDLVGLIAAYFNDPGNETGFITNVSTLNTFAGKGIASKLLENCIRFGKEKKIKQIILEVNQANRQAIKLYEKYDFKHVTDKGELKTLKLIL